MHKTSTHTFAEASNEHDKGFLGELIGFLRNKKKFWMIPLIGSLILIGALVLLGGTAAAPFIYTLF